MSTKTEFPLHFRALLEAQDKAVSDYYFAQANCGADSPATWNPSERAQNTHRDLLLICKGRKDEAALRELVMSDYAASCNHHEMRWWKAANKISQEPKGTPTTTKPSMSEEEREELQGIMTSMTRATAEQYARLMEFGERFPAEYAEEWGQWTRQGCPSSR